MSPAKPPRRRPGAESALAASTETLNVGDAQAAPPVSPTPFEQPTPEPAPEVAARNNGTKTRAKDARAAFEASVMLARTRPRDWEPYSVRLPEELWARLEERVVADQAAYRIPTLAMSHYINAALDRIPDEVQAAADMATGHMTAQGLRPAATRSSGTRLHRDVLAWMELLPAQLRRVARPGLLGHLQAAALTVFLNDLDAG